MWKEKDFKHLYQDSIKKGLKIYFSVHIDQTLKDEIDVFIKCLKSKYYFPIKLSLVIKPGKYFITKDNLQHTLGDFHYYHDDIKKYILSRLDLFFTTLQKKKKSNQNLMKYYLRLHMK